MPTSIQLSVVVPVRNAAETLAGALQAILASDIARERFELIVVDDASDDASATIAARYADTVVRLGRRAAGPAYARNRGAELARGEFVAFVDADVLVRPETLGRMASLLAGESTLDVVSARYSADRAAPGTVSQYWNLLLIYGEERERQRAARFSAACAMLRKSVFLSAGMYDEWRFHTPYLEDVELGQRLAERGHRVCSAADLEVTHVRRTSVGRIVRDVWERSVLLARSLGYRRTRVAAPGEVVFALSGSAIPAVAILAAVVLSAADSPHTTWLQKGVIVLGVAAVANMSAFLYFARKRGILFGLMVLPLHVMAQTVAAVALCTGWLLRDAIGDRAPAATIQAYSEVGVEMWPPVPRRP